MIKSGPLLPVKTGWKDGRLQIGTIPFKANMLLRRCGKYYLVDKNGTQRHIKELDGRSDEEIRNALDT